MRIQTTINIDDQDIVDVIVTALEGGSNYWYFLPDFNGINNPLLYDDSKLALSEKIGVAVLRHGLSIKINDIENPEEFLGFINKANIERGLKLYMESQGPFDAAMDADEADLFLQYVVLGEIVYG